MRKIVLFLFFISFVFSAESILGQKYSERITLKNEVLYVDSNTKKSFGNTLLNSSINTNNIYENFKVKEDYLCPIKGVKINKHRDWLGFIEYEDGSILAISSPKYTFALYNKEIQKKDNHIKNIYVTDYKTKNIINAKDAYYVFGSKVVSVGGDDVMPFADEKSANEFLNNNSGKKIYRFDRMDKNFIDYLEMR
ncbi:MAG: nitrous oxide reductase accessory protein NosL [Campylobacteraceae bacterium]